MDPNDEQVPELVSRTGSQGLVRRRLTAEEFQGLAEVPPEVEWFANLTNANTRRAYRVDVGQFMDFAGIRWPEEFRLVTRAHVIALELLSIRRTKNS